ncbi:MAG: D-tyrosyl-tRNA(Tyr) deacylase [Acholeplasmatales bacterium]|jgi:D-tyrosyl-tRNA(Tyr) deacylase|nr:D-tyrosyl-tRNA(Tyr) deacylase [Acholeplasmatales bacterium]
MRLFIQVVNTASVIIKNSIYSSIDKGYLIYLGVHKNDTLDKVQSASLFIENLRIFPDKDGKLNLTLKEVSGSILIVSSFTLLSDPDTGRRPSFSNALDASGAKVIYDALVLKLCDSFKVETGVFKEDMEIKSINSGPINIYHEI